MRLCRRIPKIFDRQYASNISPAQIPPPLAKEKEVIIKNCLRSLSRRTGYKDYKENSYGRFARKTNESSRKNLASWQIPAIKKHCGDLTNKSFMDIGAGDLVLGEYLAEIGIPRVFYVQDLSGPSLRSGISRLKQKGISTDIFEVLVSDNFDFGRVADDSLDYAFSNSLFSHLSINSILLCLSNLAPKMKNGGQYFSSMIVVPDGNETRAYDWRYLQRKGTDVISYPTKDPFHYNEALVFNLSHLNVGFQVHAIHDYGHPFQKLVEFVRQ